MHLFLSRHGWQISHENVMRWPAPWWTVPDDLHSVMQRCDREVRGRECAMHNARTRCPKRPWLDVCVAELLSCERVKSILPSMRKFINPSGNHFKPILDASGRPILIGFLEIHPGQLYHASCFLCVSPKLPPSFVRTYTSLDSSTQKRVYIILRKLLWTSLSKPFTTCVHGAGRHRQKKKCDEGIRFLFDARKDLRHVATQMGMSNEMLWAWINYIPNEESF